MAPEKPSTGAPGTQCQRSTGAPGTREGTSTGAPGTTSIYDSAGRDLASINPLGYRSTVVYDKSRTVAQIDANSNRTTSVYDALGRNQATVDALNDRTTKVFDAGGRTIAQINELNRRWSMTYDLADQPIQKIDPLNRRVTSTYNAAGERTVRIDARGNRTTYAYDNAGELLRARYPDGTRTTFAYDAAGQRTLMANATGRYTTTFDELGRKKSVVSPVGQRLTYSYDANSRRVQLNAHTAGVFTYSYDSNDRLTVVKNPQGQRTSFSYDDNGRKTLSKLSTGTRTSFSYDNAGRTTRVANITSGAATIVALDYRYDKLNNRLVEIEGSTRTSFSYDAVYQVLTENRTGTNAYSNTYVYDKVGNRTLKNESGARTTQVYDVADQLIYAFDNSGQTTFTYDNSGNQIRKLEPGGERTTQLWDYESKLTLVHLPSNLRNTMSYDPDGLRAQLVESTGAKKFVYDGQAYLLETNSSNVLTAVWTNEPAQYGGIITQRRSTTDIWYIYDGLGDTRALIDNSQSTTDIYNYNAFGGPITQTGTTDNPFQWRGKWGFHKDRQTGIIQVRQRPLITTWAIWLAKDPAGFPNGLNPYKLYFVANGQDPSGLLSENLIIPEDCDIFLKRWLHREEGLGGSWLDHLPKCPCRLVACTSKGYNEVSLTVPEGWIVDRGTLPVVPIFLYWKYGISINSTHPGAHICMRKETVYGTTQQCCYGDDGLLLRGIGAGTPDRNTTGGYRDHSEADVLSFLCAMYLDEKNDTIANLMKYLQHRPPSDPLKCLYKAGIQ